MESLIREFPKIGKFPTLRSPDKSGKNSPVLQTNLEIFQREPLRGEFVENVCLFPTFFAFTQQTPYQGTGPARSRQSTDITLQSSKKCCNALG